MSTEPIYKSKEVWATALLFVLILAIYLCFPTKNYYWDGITFAQMIEDAPSINASLLHPNHLIYNLLGYLFYRAVHGLGVNIRAVTALQILNGLLSAICAVILFRILRRALRSLYHAIGLTLLFAFSATWWKFSTDADSYIASVLFLLITFYLILPGTKARPFLLGLTFSFAMAFHQLAIFFYPVAVVGLFFQSASEGRNRFLNPVKFTVAAFTLIGVAYCSSYYLITGRFDLPRFLKWITSFSPDANFSFNLGSNLFYTFRGHWRLLFGGRFNALAGLFNPFIIVLMICLAGGLVVFLYKVISRLIRSSTRPDFKWVALLKSDPQVRTLVLLSSLWTFAYVLFLFVWLPQNAFYRLFYLPALILMVATALAACERTYPYPAPRNYRLASFVVSVALFNFLFLIFPYSHTQKYPPLAFALEMNEVWLPNTIVYYGSDNSDNSLIKYFNQGTHWKQLNLKEPEQVEVELRSAEAQGAATWLDTSALNQLASSVTGSEWLKRHAVNESQRNVRSKAHDIRFVQIRPVD